ncbi:hypothetical protein ACQKMI_09440 [Lysinibacillus sp. NPDC097214]|uniref:hypothetical protein n=1 Tax=Lysinibacillus sp. NPDC097214 TaxID=3390584 RepID=UPI003D039E64
MRHKYLLKNEHGYTFLIALFVIVLISVLGLGLMFITSNTLNITKHERNDQSVFYIAEADLNVKRAEISNELESVLIPFLNKYNNDANFDIETDGDKIEKEYLELADEYLTHKINGLEDGKWAEVTNYEKQKGLQPSSQVTLIKEDQPNTYTLKSVAKIDGTSRTLSQAFTIKKPAKEKSEDEENPPSTNYNFCYGMLTNSFTTTNTLNTDADIVSLNDLTINNTGTFGKNIYAKGAITFTNTSTINGDVLSLNNITIKNGATFNKDIISRGNIIAYGGSPHIYGNVFSMGNINLKVGITTTKADGFVYAHKNFLNEQGSKISGVIFGKESVKDTTDWATGLGRKRYSMGDIVYHKGDNTTNIKAESEEKFNQYLASENIDFNYYLNKVSGRQETQNNNKCESQSFVNAQIPELPPFLNVDSSNFETIPDLSLSGGKAKTITLTNNSYIKNVSINSNLTLTIDVGNQNRTLVIDHLNASNGHIQIKGTGKLNLLVKNDLSIVNLYSSKERRPFDTTVYYEGLSAIDVSKKFESNLYVKNSAVSISSDGHISGNLLIASNKTMEVSGNTMFGNEDHHSVILVPNASLNFSGSSQIFGTVIGNKIDAVGSNTRHKFDKSKLNLDLFPPSEKQKYSTNGDFINPDAPIETP